METEIEELNKLEARLADVRNGTVERGAASETKACVLCRKIFVGYLKLSREGNIESLKRALFLIWYSYAEPVSESDHQAFEEVEREEILSRVNSLCLSNALDTELKFMISLYYSVCSWYFERVEGLDALSKASLENSRLWISEVPRHSYIERGQLGVYWAYRQRAATKLSNR